ncbi:MAG: YigZ family protein [Erysipelotrichaceae bacterium]|nr:YigZ family protein [Erysipelotrichaceae bacterium]MDP3305655.1 YigZ family protein [Erysipelotrichaceae bacterium]
MKKIAKDAQIEIDVKGSKFIGLVSLCESEEQARNYIHTIKKVHPKANHHCSAYILFQSQIERSNDDGEPSSTAGLPMLQVLRGQEVTDVVAVVVRYFGGTLLGRGGLIKAYTEAVTKAIESAGIKEFKQICTYSIEFPYSMISVVENIIQQNCHILNRDYDEQAIIRFKVENIEEIQDSLIDSTKGQAKIIHISTDWE